jgi:phosphatidate phosphatase LPIN
MGLSASASMGRAMGAAAAAESEYMWEWGAFPQRSPSIDKFVAGPSLSGIGGSKSSFLSPADTVVGRGIGARKAANKLDRLGSASPTLEPSKMSGGIGTWSLPPRPSTQTSELYAPSSAMNGANTEDAAAFGLGGRLFPNAGDDSVIWVDIEGKQFTFQLSLCGPLVYHAEGDQGEEAGRARAGMLDEVDQASRFEDAKVNFARFAADPSLLHREDLVIKWGTT